MAWLKKLVERVRAFWQLNQREKRLFLEAWVELLRVVVVLRTTMRLRLFDRMNAPGRKEKGAISASKIAEIVEKASAHHIKRTTCLERAITLQRVLKRRGHDAPLRIGVSSASNNFEAHAWLESPLLPPDAQSPCFAVLEFPVSCQSITRQ